MQTITVAGINGIMYSSSRRKHGDSFSNGISTSGTVCDGKFYIVSSPRYITMRSRVCRSGGRAVAEIPNVGSDISNRGYRAGAGKSEVVPTQTLYWIVNREGSCGLNNV